jgi:hypothetical protein
MDLEGDVLSYNSAISGLGGAVDNLGSGSIGGSVLSSNSAVGGGAVLNEYGGQLTLSFDWLTSNTASVAGGAVFNQRQAVLNMSGNTVSGNTAAQGGGIWNSGTLAMTGDNVSYNSLAPYSPNLQPLGSGLYNDAGIFGVGIVGLDGSTFIGNNFNPDGSFGGDLYGV